MTNIKEITVDTTKEAEDLWYENREAIKNGTLRIVSREKANRIDPEVARYIEEIEEERIAETGQL